MDGHREPLTADSGDPELRLLANWIAHPFTPSAWRQGKLGSELATRQNGPQKVVVIVLATSMQCAHTDVRAIPAEISVSRDAPDVTYRDA